MQATDEHLNFLGITVGQPVWEVDWKRPDLTIAPTHQVFFATIHEMTVDRVDCREDMTRRNGLRLEFYIFVSDQKGSVRTPCILEYVDGVLQNDGYSLRTLFTTLADARSYVMETYLEYLEKGTQAVMEASRINQILIDQFNDFTSEHGQCA